MLFKGLSKDVPLKILSLFCTSSSGALSQNKAFSVNLYQFSEKSFLNHLHSDLVQEISHQSLRMSHHLQKISVIMKFAALIGYQLMRYPT